MRAFSRDRTGYLSRRAPAGALHTLWRPRVKRSPSTLTKSALRPYSHQEKPHTCSGCGHPIPPTFSYAQNSSPSSVRKLYHPLKSNGTEVRLVRVQPGAWDDPIRCELYTTTLARSILESDSLQPDAERQSGTDVEHIQYGGQHASERSAETDQPPKVWRALSHVWGSDDATLPIVVNDSVLNIRENLYEALAWLRYYGCHQPLWIDALCINQSDPSDRSSQVQLMKQIFSYAAETIVYMPTRVYPLADCAELVAHIKASPILEDEEALAVELLKSAHMRDDMSLIVRYLEVMSRPGDPAHYWNRLWTVQECALAQSLTLMCGPLRLSWDQYQHFQEKAVKVATGASTLYDASQTKLWAFASRGAHTRDTLRKSQGTHDLLETLVQLYSHGCADPRDRIYAVMGLINDDTGDPSASFRIDYNLCTACVWKTATSWIIQNTQRLDVLGCAGHAREDIPSWVPDWSELFHVATWLDHYRSRNRLNNTAHSHHITGSGALVVQGCVIGKITGRLFIEHRHEPGTLPTPEQSRQIMASIRSFVPDATYMEDIAALLYDTAPLLKNEHNAAILADIRPLCTGEKMEDGEQTEMSKFFFGLFMDPLCDRWIVLVDVGAERLAVGQASRLEGDGGLVCFVPGCDIPLILHQEGSDYRIVGQCAVLGYSEDWMATRSAGSGSELTTFNIT